MYCKQCGSKLDNNERCSKCNAKVGKGIRFCENCGSKRVQNDAFCATCGNNYGKTTTAIEGKQNKQNESQVLKSEQPSVNASTSPFVGSVKRVQQPVMPVKSVSSNPLLQRIAMESGVGYQKNGTENIGDSKGADFYENYGRAKKVDEERQAKMQEEMMKSMNDKPKQTTTRPAPKKMPTIEELESQRAEKAERQKQKQAEKQQVNKIPVANKPQTPVTQQPFTSVVQAVANKPSVKDTEKKENVFDTKDKVLQRNQIPQGNGISQGSQIPQMPKNIQNTNPQQISELQAKNREVRQVQGNKIPQMPIVQPKPFKRMFDYRDVLGLSGVAIAISTFLLADLTMYLLCFVVGLVFSIIGNSRDKKIGISGVIVLVTSLITKAIYFLMNYYGITLVLTNLL